MLDTLIWVAVFILSLAVLVKSSDYFTEAARVIGIALSIPAFIVGVTIVSIGTSLPELLSSLFAVFQGSTEIVAGNVVGSNIANILLVGGVAAVLSKKIVLGWELQHVDLPFLLSSVLILGLTMIDGKFTLGEGIACLIAYGIYLAYTVESLKKHKDKVKVKKEKLHWYTIAILVASGIMLFIGAKYTVESVIRLSEIFQIGTEVIAVTAVAFGTSLPEVAVTLTAARRGQAEIAIGNIFGSNIFNSFVVMGIPAFFSTLIVPASLIYLALPLMAGATLLFYLVTQDKIIGKWEGWIFALIYIFFVLRSFSII